MSASDYYLIRAKREWVPERVWRFFCIANLATWEPFRTILTMKGPTMPSHTKEKASVEERIEGLEKDLEQLTRQVFDQIDDRIRELERDLHARHTQGIDNAVVNIEDALQELVSQFAETAGDFASDCEGVLNPTAEAASNAYHDAGKRVARLLAVIQSKELA